MLTAAPPRLLHVLVVDDDARVRDVLVGYLYADGHTADTARNGREGLERFCEGAYDVVVTDRAMPELCGDKMAAAIKRLAPATPVIMITAFGDLLHATLDGEEGADVLVSKPIRLSQFRETLASVLGPAA